MELLPKTKNFPSLLLKAFALLLPFYFLPFTNDVLEINKTVLLFVTVFVLLGFLVYLSYQRRSFVFVTSYVSLPLFALLVAVIFSTFFSISANYSYWGYYGSLSNTFWGYVLLIVFAFLVPLFIAKKKDVRSVAFYYLVGLFVVSLHSLLSYFNALSFLQGTPLFFLGVYGFLLVGSFLVLKIALFLGSVLALYFILTSKVFYKVLFTAVALAFFLATSALYFGALTFGLVLIALLVPLALFKDLLERHRLIALGIALGFGLLVLGLSSAPSVSNTLGLNKRAQFLPLLDTRTSWVVTNAVLGSRPLFGSGIGTFINAYTRFKPSYINGSAIWDTRFFKPNSFYLLVLSELGLVGFFALAFLVFSLFYSWFKAVKNPSSLKEPKDNDKYFLFTLRYLILLILVGFAFIPGGAFLVISLFLLIGLLSAFEMMLGSPRVKKQEVGIALSRVVPRKKKSVSGISSLGADYKVLVSYKPVAIVVLILYVFAGYFTYRVFAADIAYRGFFSKKGTLIDIRRNRLRAARINPTNDVYQRGVSNVNRSIVFAFVRTLNEKKDLDDNTKKDLLNNIQQLINESSLRLRYITSDSDFGINVLNWEARALFYHNLIGLDKNSANLALQSYLTANSLEPSNPRLLASVGAVYYAIENYNQARTYFERAILLKTDYAAAWYNYAKTLEKLGNYVQAYNSVQRVLSLLQEGNRDYEIAQKYAEDLKPKAEEALRKAAQARKAREEAKKESEIKVAEDNKAQSSNQPGLNQPNQPLKQAPAPRQNTDTSQDKVNSDLPLGNSNTLPNQEPAKEGEGFIENPSN